MTPKEAIQIVKDYLKGIPVDSQEFQIALAHMLLIAELEREK